MISLSLHDAARAMNGRLLGHDSVFSGVSTDSRQVTAGQLFFALRGERFDGHGFAGAVLDAGAAAVVVEQEQPGLHPQIVVADTRLALGALARHWREQFAIPVIAITGSNGKTTVKEMVASIAREAFGAAHVHATSGNFNNDIGLPLTLFRLGREHACLILEMGMNHPGELSYLSRLAEPSVALVNNAQAAHLEGLGSVEAVAHAKGEIYEGLIATGTGIVNAEDAYAPLWRELIGARHRLEFGLQHGDVRVEVQQHGALHLCTPEGVRELRLQVPGEHNWRNAAAAAAGCLALGIELDAVVRGLEAFTGVKGRLQRARGYFGSTVIDDTYNANPGSVRAAIDVLRREPGVRLLVLGDIGELGRDSRLLHRELGEVARTAGLDGLFTLGEHMQEAAAAYGPGAQHFETAEALVAALVQRLAADVTVLVKGSRFMKMERVVHSITEQE